MRKEVKAPGGRAPPGTVLLGLRNREARVPSLAEGHVEAALGRDQPGEDVSDSTWLSAGPLQAPSPPLLPQSRDRKMVGDVIGAQSYASTAKCLNIWALVLGLLVTTAVIITVIVTATSAQVRGPY